MKKFIVQIVLFLIIGIAVGEVVIRTFNLTIDVPKTYQDKNGLVRYYPNQEGNYQNGTHTWKVNKYGYSGDAPESLNNLIVILGDSYIENFMNPVSCHQSNYLKKLLPEYNYFEASRAGATIFELMETSKGLDTLNPKLQVLYVKSNDFLQSLASHNKNVNHVRLDLDKNEILNAKYKGSIYKDALYNFKFAYYLYRNVWLANDENADRNVEDKATDEELPLGEISRLIEYIKKNYKISDKILVFGPTSDPRIIKMCNDAGFRTYFLSDKGDKDWKLENDSHWSCYGHERVAGQVKGFIDQSLK